MVCGHEQIRSERAVDATKDIMSRIIEGSLEILRPIDGKDLEESISSHQHDDEESDDFDEDDSDSFMKTDEASGSNDAEWQSKLELLRQYRE